MSKPNKQTGKQVSITKTKGQWLHIERCLRSEYPKKSKRERQTAEMLASHIRKEIAKIKIKMNFDDTAICCLGGDKEEKRPYVPLSVAMDIKEIASKINTSEANVIEMFIMIPLLNRK